MLRNRVRGFALIPAFAGVLLGQGKVAEQRAGRDIFRSTCAACHGADGRGAPDTSRGFEAPPTFPDFTACVATAREPDRFWSAIIHNGGPDRGFVEIMPSFRDLPPKKLEQLADFLASLD